MVFLVSYWRLDKYYKNFSHGTEKLKLYDFDNPGAIDWEKVTGVLKAIHDDDEKIPCYEYSFVTKESTGPHLMDNMRPKVIIIEGIYAFNSISKKVFNYLEFDPLDSSKIVDPEFKSASFSFPKFNILKIRLAICKSKSKEVRISRDIIQRNKTKDYAIIQFDEQVWPATYKWVYSNKFREHIKLVHGSFNLKGSKLLLGALSRYFLEKPITYKDFMYNGDFYQQSIVSCSLECEFQSDCDISLNDYNKE